MNYKAIIPVFMLLATLAMVHAKPSPAWVYIMSNQAFKDAVREEETVQAHKEKAAVQTGQASSLQELSNVQQDVKDSVAYIECGYPRPDDPGLWHICTRGKSSLPYIRFLCESYCTFYINKSQSTEHSTQL